VLGFELCGGVGLAFGALGSTRLGQPLREGQAALVQLGGQAQGCLGGGLAKGVGVALGGQVGIQGLG
jgi:hypothetical protein